MSPLIDEDSIKAYEALENVIVKVMKPNNDLLQQLVARVGSIESKLDDKYYTKDWVDEKFETLREELRDLKERNAKLLAGAGTVVLIVSALIQWIHK